MSGLELVLVVLTFTSLVATYYLYFEKSLQKNPARVKKLRNKYLLHDDWYYEVAAVHATITKTKQRVNNYLIRNKLVFANHHNINYGLGEKLLAELKVVEQDYLVEKPESETHLGDISAVKLEIKA